MDKSTFTGSNFFRQRLVLATLSGKPIVIENIRDGGYEPGINEYENSLLQLLNLITDGSTITINETGTIVTYSPGLLVGGNCTHNCSTQRGIGYYLEALLCLAPFCKKALNISLKGVTNDSIDNSVDAIKFSSVPVLKRFILDDEGLEIKVISRGMLPDGGGEVQFQCPIINTLRPVQFLDPGKVKRVRGVAFAIRVSPVMANRMVDAAKKILLGFLPDVYIYTDHYKGVHSGKSPGFGLTLVAETTTGAFYCAEACSRPSGSEKGLTIPEDIAKKATFALLEEIYRGGCVDSTNQNLACLFMALGTTDVSKLKTGPLSPYTIKFLQHVEHFFQHRMKLETDKSDLKQGSSKVLLTCVGIGFSNLSKKIS